MPSGFRLPVQRPHRRRRAQRAEIQVRSRHPEDPPDPLHRPAERDDQEPQTAARQPGEGSQELRHTLSCSGSWDDLHARSSHDTRSMTRCRPPRRSNPASNHSTAASSLLASATSSYPKVKSSTIMRPASSLNVPPPPDSIWYGSNRG